MVTASVKQLKQKRHPHSLYISARTVVHTAWREMSATTEAQSRCRHIPPSNHHCRWHLSWRVVVCGHETLRSLPHCRCRQMSASVGPRADSRTVLVSRRILGRVGGRTGSRHGPRHSAVLDAGTGQTTQQDSCVNQSIISLSCHGGWSNGLAMSAGLQLYSD